MKKSILTKWLILSLSLPLLILIIVTYRLVNCDYVFTIPKTYEIYTGDGSKHDFPGGMVNPFKKKKYRQAIEDFRENGLKVYMESLDSSYYDYFLKNHSNRIANIPKLGKEWEYDIIALRKIRHVMPMETKMDVLIIVYETGNFKVDDYNNRREVPFRLVFVYHEPSGKIIEFF